MAFRLVQFVVPFLVSCWRPVSRLVFRLVLASSLCLVGWRSRVGVGVSLLVSFLVSSRRPVLSVVPCRRYPIVPFLSARVLVSSRLVSSLPSFYSCSSRRACRMALRWSGWAIRNCRGVVCGVALRYAMRDGMAAGGSMMPCRVAWCTVRDEERDAWRDDGRDDICAVFVSSI